MGSATSRNPMIDPKVRDRILEDVSDESLKQESNASAVSGGQPQPVPAYQKLIDRRAKKNQPKKPSDEEHPSYTQAEMLEAEENFKTIRKFLEKYHKALGDKNLAEFLALLDRMKPLKDDNSRNFIKRFNGSEGLAIQELLSLQNILNLWERESLARYLKHKAEQNRLLVSESTFKTIAQQEEQREFFYSKFDQKSSPRKTEEKEKNPLKVTTKISFNNNDKDVELSGALDLIKERKSGIDNLVLVESLHYRAIRELLKINKSNIALIQYLKPSFDETTSSSNLLNTTNNN